jgi:hypothetical protein
MKRAPHHRVACNLDAALRHPGSRLRLSGIVRKSTAAFMNTLDKRESAFRGDPAAKS